MIKKTVLPISLATIWISISEFVRNELLFRNYWIEHYERLGLVFPSEPINGAIWGLWSLFLAISIFIISKKFSFIQTLGLSWMVGFVLMWIVIGNMGVLPVKILYVALPLSIFEVFLATLIIKKI
jgi:hypothetical protein